MIQAIEMMPLRFSVQKEWRVRILFAFFLGGLGAGLFVLSQYFEYTLGVVLGLLIVGVGKNAFHLWYLGRPERFYRAVMRPGTSWISRGFISIVVFLVFGVLYVAPSLLTGLPWTATDALGTAFRIIASVGAISVMVYTGFVMSASPSIPFWNTTILPVMFLLYGLVGGLDLIFITTALGAKGLFDLEQLELLQTMLMLAALLFVLGYLLIMHNSSPAGAAAVKVLTTGDMSLSFLGGVVVVGLLIPVVVMAYTYLTGATNPTAAGIAGFLTLVGGLLFRWSVLRAGLYSPLL